MIKEERKEWDKEGRKPVLQKIEDENQYEKEAICFCSVRVVFIIIFNL